MENEKVKLWEIAKEIGARSSGVKSKRLHEMKKRDRNLKKHRADV